LCQLPRLSIRVDATNMGNTFMWVVTVALVDAFDLDTACHALLLRPARAAIRSGRGNRDILESHISRQYLAPPCNLDICYICYSIISWIPKKPPDSSPCFAPIST